MRFTKMEGAGNDYVYINLFEETLSKPDVLAVQMSKRSYGVGSDGLVLISPCKKADLKMVMYNADGTEAEMCGNAIRCVAKYAWEHRLTEKKKMSVETGAGIKELQLNLDNEDNIKSVTVSMGAPFLESSAIPSSLDGDRIINHVFDFGGQTFSGTLVSMGNPHFVTFVDDVENFPVEKWGPVIENSDLFPNRINVEFVQIINRSEVIQRTWERGSGETWACGTGASAVGVAGVLTNQLDPDITVHLIGGDLEISWKGEGESVLMTGDAKEVFSGDWNLQ
ncbi:MAG: diaminopimelate epimerase [Proteobacteria bacterium]|nr:diaminopimelate epimerase [Pseudomonadota bacterium]